MKSRLLISVILAAIGAIAGGWIYQSQSRISSEKAELVVPDNIDYFMTNLNYRVMTKAGELDYTFSSSRLEHYNQNDVSRIEAPSLQIFRKRQQWQIDSKQGEIQHDIHLLHLSQQVVMQRLGQNPLQIYSESLRFEPDLDLVSSDAGILLVSGSSRIEAQQAVFDLADKVYSLSKTRATYFNGKS